MPVTLHDVAEAAGVSVATASRALTNSEHPVAEETRQRILQLAENLGYRPNLVARSLRTDRTLTIGIIVENILSVFIPPIIRGIQDRLNLDGYFGIIINSDWDREKEIEAIRALDRRKIDGIVFVESWHRSSDSVLELIDKPHVFVHRLFDSYCANSVVPDDCFGARLAVKHLAELGHRRIAYINGPDGWDASKNRLTGYYEELEVYQIPFDEMLVERGDWSVKSGYQAAQSLIGVKEPPTAIFAGNDLMALGVVYALQEAGLRVPDDVAVVGYDDREFTGFVRPAITTVTMPCWEMGRTSAELLLSLCEGSIEVVDAIRVRGELIVRQSCGAREGEWEFEPERGSVVRKREAEPC